MGGSSVTGSFTCQICGKEFDLSQTVLDRYPGWSPRLCLDCKRAESRAMAGTKPQPKPTATTSRTKSKDLTTAEVLASYIGGPDTGVFTTAPRRATPGREGGARCT